MTEANKRRRSQAERREEAEKRLIDTAIELMASRGYDGFTLAEVGEAAGYSRGLPAHYFGKKDDLLVAVVEFLIEDYNRHFEKESRALGGMLRIETLVRSYTRAKGRSVRALSMLIGEAIVRPVLRRTITRLNAKGLERIESIIRDGITDNTIRPDVDVKRQAAIIYSFLRGQTNFALCDTAFDAEGVAEEFILLIRDNLSLRPKLGGSKNG
ncbi:TetR/AcrR family transcriptional regulator [Acetobacter sacchari]|uniref:TetR/AcrR family transcriptional regulator n=1 Tax=Acetobacter sacchari TaxID=2661687 RepID=A0ABS3M0L7_9PROT|nr:TetR/AcrR family transcriptional regulator [Acetobacter sacchari]